MPKNHFSHHDIKDYVTPNCEPPLHHELYHPKLWTTMPSWTVITPKYELPSHYGPYHSELWVKASVFPISSLHNIHLTSKRSPALPGVGGTCCLHLLRVSQTTDQVICKEKHWLLTMPFVKDIVDHWLFYCAKGCRTMDLQGSKMLRNKRLQMTFLICFPLMPNVSLRGGGAYRNCELL